MLQIRRVRLRSAVLGLSVLLVPLVGLTGAAAEPELQAERIDEFEGEQRQESGPGIRVNSPSELADFFPAVPYSGTAAIDDQTADIAYAGTGCTLASYAGVDVAGKVALVDDIESPSQPSDCVTPTTFAQKVQNAEQSGAIGYIQIPREGDEATGGNAISASIPAVEVDRTDDTLAVRDAVIEGMPVNATFTIASVTGTPGGAAGLSDIPCVDGQAGPFECDGIDLQAFVPQEEFNGAGISDLWGWTDPDNGDEYVIVGKTNGVAFFNITEPTAPVYLGELPNPGLTQVIWHDIKVYENHAFIVSESEQHGMAVFDLTKLRDVPDAPVVFERDATYDLASAVHNLEINTETGFAYLLGGNMGIVVTDQCLSGLHMVDISEPTSPTFAGCYLEEGGPGTAARTLDGATGLPVNEVSQAAYVHDTNCVIYDGPDTDHVGKEVCFNSAEEALVIADVTDKLVPQTLGSTSYDDVAYTHQGWLTEDHRYLIANDELDETTFGFNTRSIVFDVSDLDNPVLHFINEHDTTSIDHNNYVHEGFLYQSHYTAGLRVQDTSGLADKTLEEVAFFDTFPAHDMATFNGTWSNYPFFESGTIPVSGIDEGLFLLSVQEDALNPGGPDDIPDPDVPDPDVPDPDDPDPDDPDPDDPDPDDPDPDDPDPDDPGGTQVTVRRVAGEERIETAVRLSQDQFDSADRVVLARSDLFPDALASSSLAAEVGGPVLLTQSEGLSDLVAQELDRLGTTQVYLAGGTAALSEQVQADLAALDVSVTRLDGVARYHTAALIAREVVALGGPVEQAIVVRADDFADALSAGTLAAYGRAPILLTDTGSLHPRTAEALAEVLTTDDVFIAGGAAAVAAETEAELAAEGYTVTRLSGNDRYGTTIAIAEEAVRQGAEITTVFLASGADFPDALGAASAAFQSGGVFVLVHPDDLSDSPATRDFLGDDQIAEVVIVGGPAAVSDAVRDAIATLLNGD